MSGKTFTVAVVTKKIEGTRDWAATCPFCKVVIRIYLGEEGNETRKHECPHVLAIEEDQGFNTNVIFRVIDWQEKCPTCGDVSRREDPGTPKTLIEAIQNGLTDRIEASQDYLIKIHVKDFLAQKFTVARAKCFTDDEKRRMDELFEVLTT